MSNTEPILYFNQTFERSSTFEWDANGPRATDFDRFETTWPQVRAKTVASNQSKCKLSTCITVGDSTFVKGLGDWKSRLIWVDLTVGTEFGDSWFLSTIGVEVGGGAAGELGNEA